MKLLLLFAFVVAYAATAESRYPYDDTYTPGNIVPGLNGRYTYGRDYRYERRHGRGGGGFSGILPKKNNGYGRHKDDALLNRDYRRRYKNSDYLPPRGIGGYKSHYERPGYDYDRQRRPHISGPPGYYGEDDVDYGGYRKTNVGRGTRYF